MDGAPVQCVRDTYAMGAKPVRVRDTYTMAAAPEPEPEPVLAAAEAAGRKAAAGTSSGSADSTPVRPLASRAAGGASRAAKI